jgi:hypothetical protein
MPHRRPRKKGSFGGHLDELLKQFEHERKEDSGERDKASEDKRDSERGLFERSWRKPDERRGG